MTAVLIFAGSQQRGHCRSCNAPIDWAIAFKTGARIPFNPPIVLLPTLPLDGDDPKVVRVDMAQTTSHFATCPQAEAWRKRRAALEARHAGR
jgi:hypothetical protein